MAEYVNAALGQERVVGVSYSSHASLISLREAVVQKLHQLDCHAGVLIVADMEPLTDLNEFLFRNTGVHCTTIANASLPALLAIAEAGMRPGMTLHLLAEEALSLVSGSPSRQSMNFIDSTINKMLVPTLTFLNPQKASKVLSSTLSEILNDFGISPANDIAVKFIFHCAHML